MLSISIHHFLFLGAILFTIGVLGIFLNKKNVIIILMSIELILLSVNINFVAFSSYSGDISGLHRNVAFDCSRSMGYAFGARAHAAVTGVPELARSASAPL